MGMIYLFTLRYQIPFQQFTSLSILSLTTIIGFASFGYLFNDLFDIEKDAIAGKSNFLSGKSLSFKILLFLISAGFTLLPWVYLPKNDFSLVLILLQLLMFALYSIPPIRLKERGIAGIVTDSFYAHSVPVLLAAYTYSLAAGKAFFTLDILLLFLWQTLSGLRNIVLHQIEDMEADKKSGSNNFISGLPEVKVNGLLKGLIFFELFFCLFLFTILSIYNLFFLISLIVILVLAMAGYTELRGKNMDEFLVSGKRFFPNGIYERWLPPVILFSLGFCNPWFFGVMLVHLAIFNFNFYIQAADKAYGQWKSIPIKGKFIKLRVFLSYPVNYTLYYTFKIFSVDLKSQNMSAATFLLSKFGKKSSSKKNG